MPQETTLLAYLVPRLTSSVEDSATDALAFILNKSPACRDALGLLLSEGEGSYQLDALASFDTQVTYKDGSRPSTSLASTSSCSRCQPKRHEALLNTG